MSEEVYGYTSGVDLETSHYITSIRNYCTSCRKGIHTGVNSKKEIIRRCKGVDCECKCRTHYVGLDGKLRPYGTPDNSIDTDIPPKFDPFIESINKKFKKMQVKKESKK